MSRDEKLVGFIYCRGKKDFSCWETEAISEEDQNAIEEILIKYDDKGTAEGNVYDRKFKDILMDDYGVVKKKKENELSPMERGTFNYAKAFFDEYCPYTPKDEIDYCMYNFREMLKTDFENDSDNERLKGWLLNIINIWPDDLYVIQEEKEESHNG